MKLSVFWDVMLCSPAKSTNILGEEITSMFRAELCLLLDSCWFLAWLTLQPWRWRRYVPLKHWLTFTGLYDVISQKTALVHPCTIITAVSHLVSPCDWVKCSQEAVIIGFRSKCIPTLQALCYYSNVAFTWQEFKQDFITEIFLSHARMESNQNSDDLKTT
jgi:hypothetical protein